MVRNLLMMRGSLVAKTLTIAESLMVKKEALKLIHVDLKRSDMSFLIRMTSKNIL